MSVVSRPERMGAVSPASVAAPLRPAANRCQDVSESWTATARSATNSVNDHDCMRHGISSHAYGLRHLVVPLRLAI